MLFVPEMTSQSATCNTTSGSRGIEGWVKT